MKIKGVEQFINIKSQPGHKVQQDEGFNQIFNKTISNINAQNAVAPVDAKVIALQQGDEVLMLLDKYAHKLADASTSLKEIHPLVVRIEKAVNDMQVSAAKTSDRDADVNRFLNKIAVTANVAMFKFQRGDFLP